MTMPASCSLRSICMSSNHCSVAADSSVHIRFCVQRCLFSFSAAARTPAVRGRLASPSLLSVEPVSPTSFRSVHRCALSRITRHYRLRLVLVSAACRWRMGSDTRTGLLSVISHFRVSVSDHVLEISSFSTPLVDVGKQHYVSGPLGWHTPRILRSCPGRPRIL